MRTVVEGLHGREFHRLHAGDDRAGPVAGRGRDQREDEAEGRSDGDALAGHLLLAPPEQVPCADAHDEQRRQHERRGDGVEELVHRHGRKEHVPERGHLVAHRFEVERTAYGILHPCVGDQNPQGREVGPDGREPCRREVEALRDLVPSEEHDGDEGALHEEGHDALDGQRGTEDVAHEMRVVGPVGAEFEFEDDARRHADGEVDAEQAHPEFGGPFPEFVARADVEGLHDGEDEAQSQRERHEKPVVDGRHGELRTRPIDCLQVIG